MVILHENRVISYFVRSKYKRHDNCILKPLKTFNIWFILLDDIAHKPWCNFIFFLDAIISGRFKYIEYRFLQNKYLFNQPISTIFFIKGKYNALEIWLMQFVANFIHKSTCLDSQK